MQPFKSPLRAFLSDLYEPCKRHDFHRNSYGFHMNSYDFHRNSYEIIGIPMEIIGIPMKIIGIPMKIIGIPMIFYSLSSLIAQGACLQSLQMRPGWLV